MISSPRVTRLTQAIRTLLHSGLSISADTLQHIDSAFGNLPPVVMKQRLADSEDCETGTLTHLIFSPDLSVQITLEKTLCNAIYTLDDVETLQAGLLRQPPRTTIVFADHRRKLDLTMSPDGVTVFVDGLHIDRTIPGAVARCISRHLPADRQMTVRVALRNSITVYSRPVVKFLCRLFDRAPLLQPDLQGCVDTAVAFLSATGEKPDLFRRLGELKTAYVRMLRQAAIAEKQLKDGNTETLMLRGTRLFQIDRQETQRHIARIDAVAMAVFGRLPACLEKAQAFNIDVPSDPQNSVIRIGRLFR